ncbi:MAG: SH3 domain-containing protein [Rhodospirillales bacterium]|nr:SH3 domain-containing protein [Rhodospirillales bacterium]
MRRFVAIAALLLLAACAQAPVAEKAPERLTALLSATTTARVAPDNKSAKVMVLPANTLIAIEDGADGWYLADLDSYGDFGKGWLPHDFLTIDPPRKKDGTVWTLPAQLKNESILRDGAGTWAAKLDTLRAGTRVRVVERQLDWYRIDQPKPGWLRHDNAYIDVRTYLNAR